MTIMELLDILDGCGLIVTDDELIRETLLGNSIDPDDETGIKFMDINPDDIIGLRKDG